MGDASTSDATALVSSGEATAATSAAEDRREEVVLLHHEGNGNGSGGGSLSANNSAEEDDKAGGNVEDGGDRSNNSAGNRWPRPETLALLQIRSDMDAAFRDSSLKAPLWEEVSRKLAELGYKRSAKKCKEKFENVYKYHKRTKDGRTGKPDRSKTYRFFDQLEAFEQNHHPPPPPPPPPQKPHQIMTSVSHNTFFPPNPTITNITPLPPPNNPLPIPQTIITNTTTNKSSDDNNNNNSNGVPLSSPTSSSSTASDEEFQARHKRKRKWRHFFRRLTREVVRKQEEMQKRFLETVGKCEEERTAREEAWRLQEMARINREHEILLQERSAATAKDAAVILLLQKVSAGVTTGHNLATSVDNIFSSVHDKNINFNPAPSAPAPAPPPPPPPPAAAVPVSARNTYAAPPPSLRNLSTTSSSNSSSRWPKAEVEALISLRRNLDLKYQEKVPKGPLWEEISAGMRRLGYDRSSKRCKEKWENINKYFKKLKDSNKKRSGDSKTCPYFQKLAEIYGEGSKSVGMSEKVVPQLQPPPPPPLQRFGMEPLMVQPERQWPVQPDRNDMVLEEEDEEEEEYEGDEEDHRDTSSTTEMEEDHDDHQQGTDIRSSVDMVE